MSPEQAAGRVDELGPASDVYSLGATLYCLLTGEVPIQDKEPNGGGKLDLEAMLAKVITGDYPRPRQIAPDVDPALEAICLRAMALQRADRYGSPRALADDLELWLADKPVSAWPEPWTARTGAGWANTKPSSRVSSRLFWSAPSVSGSLPCF